MSYTLIHDSRSDALALMLHCMPQLGALCDNINYKLMSNALEADLEAKVET